MIFKINISRILTQFIVFMMISFIPFYAINPPFIFYSLICIMIWIIVFTNLSMNNNRTLFYITANFFCANFVSLTLVKYLVHRTLIINTTNIIFSALCIMPILYTIVYLSTNRDVITYKGSGKILYAKREYDLQRIIGFINEVDVIGLNGLWGSGKSFLTEKLVEHLEADDYIVIKIDLLSCNMNEFQETLLSAIEQSLISQKIMPLNSNRLKKIFSNDKISFLSNIILPLENSYSNILKEFKKELNKLDRRIVIVYEDIDRIGSSDIIKMIFSATESLASCKTKVIYQFDFDHLISDKISREYLDKYISFIINLSPINFEEAVNSIFKSGDLSLNILSEDDLNYLSKKIYVNYHLENKLKLKSDIYLVMDNISIRTLKNFIIETDIILSENTNFHSKDNKRTAITFTFIKYYFPYIYEELVLGKGFLDTIKFQYNNLWFTIFELMSMGEQESTFNSNGDSKVITPSEVLAIKENSDKLALLSLYGYDFNRDSANDISFESQSENSIRASSTNEKKDRIIWNLLYKGKSEYTDYENATNRFINDVLNVEVSQQKKAFVEYWNYMYNSKFEKADNTTIFKIGISKFITLAESLVACNIGSDIWLKFIEFYVSNKSKSDIDLEFINILSLAPLENRKTYIYIIKLFNSMNVIGNMNTSTEYYKFIRKYFRGLSSLGYTDTHELDMIINESEELIYYDGFERYTKILCEKIRNLRDNIPIIEIKEELNNIIQFMECNIRIVLCDIQIVERKPQITTSYSSSYRNQDEFDKLSSFKKTMEPNRFKEEISKSYEAGMINVYEIDKLFIENDDI